VSNNPPIATFRRCVNCGSLMLWDSAAQANCCINGHFDYPLIPGATVPRQRPPTGHTGVDLNRAKAIRCPAPTVLDA